MIKTWKIKKKAPPDIKPESSIYKLILRERDVDNITDPNILQLLRDKDTFVAQDEERIYITMFRHMVEESKAPLIQCTIGHYFIMENRLQNLTRTMQRQNTNKKKKTA